MPFTPAHAALLPPLKKTRIRIADTAFLAGALVPDFESFLLLRNAEKFGHTVAGVFLLDLPLAILLAISFHSLVKEPLIRHLPSGWRNRFQKETRSNWYPTLFQNPLLSIFSILLGIGSHLFWDAFTHAGGFFVELFPLLLYNIKSLDYKPVFFLIQVISSIGGCAYVVYRIQQRKPVDPSPTPSSKIFTFWFLLILLAALILFLRVTLTGSRMSNADWVKAAMGAAVYSMLLCCIAMTLTGRQQKRTA